MKPDNNVQGSMSIDAMERILVLISAKRYGCERGEMAVSLGVDRKTLTSKIANYGLEGVFSSYNSKQLIINELAVMKEKYPIIFEVLGKKASY